MIDVILASVIWIAVVGFGVLAFLVANGEE